MSFITHPIAALLWFAVYLASAIYDDFLNDAYQYIFDYYFLFHVMVMCLAISFAQSAYYYMLKQKTMFYTFLGLNAFFLSLDFWIFDTVFEYLGFQFNVHHSWHLMLAAIAFYFLMMHMVLHRTGRLTVHEALLMALPIILLLAYAYLSHYDFFRERKGTFPEYVQTLQHRAHIQNAKSIEAFLAFDKDEKHD